MMKDIFIIKDFFEKSEEVLKFLKSKNCKVNLIEKKETLNLEKNKSTIVCSKKFDQPGVNKQINEVNNDDIILDIGIDSTKKIDQILKESRTVLWNGPFGLFEYDDFANGTNEISRSIARYSQKKGLISVAGGGDTFAAIKKSNTQTTTS